MARVGIIGTGWGARVQVPAFREAGLEVVAIVGHNAERTRKIAGQLDVEPFGDWRKLIASNVDLVTIVTPPSEQLVSGSAIVRPLQENDAVARAVLDATNRRMGYISLT